MYIEKNTEEKIKLFENKLLNTNRGYNFYIEWSNLEKLNKYEIELNALDTLIGKKENFDEKFKELLEKLPKTVELFPFLFALSKAERKEVIKKNHFLDIIGSELDSPDSQSYNFNGEVPFTEKEIEKYLLFFEQMGLKIFYQNFLEKSTLDYIYGVLVGLDSNGRKNRGGKAFELACEPIIKDIAKKYDVEVFTQKQFKYLRKKELEISVDVENRKADFILLKDKKCMNIEVNFYKDSGSKPEEIIDSYINRQSDLSKNNIMFTLITDGNCWKGTTNQLRKGFNHIKYLMNYKMMKDGAIEEIIRKEFAE